MGKFHQAIDQDLAEIPLPNGDITKPQDDKNWQDDVDECVQSVCLYGSGNLRRIYGDFHAVKGGCDVAWRFGGHGFVVKIDVHIG